MDVVDKYQQTRKQLFGEYGIEFASRFVQGEGGKRIHFLELGSGPPLVLVHGGGSHCSEWFTILKPLSQHYHLYVVDRPGCGLSYPVNYSGSNFRTVAPGFLKMFLDAVGLNKASFLAQSMGGYFSICFAMDHPQCVEKLVLIGAPAGMNHYIPPVLRALGTKGLNRFLAATVGKPSIQNLKNIHRQLLVFQMDRLPELYFEHGFYSQQLPGSRTGFLSLLERVTTWRGWRKDLYIGDQLHQLSLPVGFIWGDQDAFESPTTGRSKANAIAKCQFETVSEAGHCPWLDQPEACAELALAMLSSL